MKQCRQAGEKLVKEHDCYQQNAVEVEMSLHVSNESAVEVNSEDARNRQ